MTTFVVPYFFQKYGSSALALTLYIILCIILVSAALRLASLLEKTQKGNENV